MAKVDGPLFSLSAHGDIGGALRYQNRKGTNYVKKLNNLPSSMSAKQRTWRQHYRDVWNDWYGIGFFGQLLYAMIASMRGYQSGHHYYLFVNL